MSIDPTRVTASMLYDIVMCEHRPWMDLYAPPDRRDKVSAFVEMLWRRGLAREEEVVSNVAEPLLNLRSFPLQERENRTLEAMSSSIPLIYGGRISADDLLGEPDLLRKCEAGYVPGDIKSGAGDEGPAGGDRKPKEHYAVQLALYVDVLERRGFSGGRFGFVWDIHGADVTYDLSAPKGPKTATSLWNDYERCLELARDILSGRPESRPAFCAACKQCWWYSACLASMESVGDLTLIQDLGRSRREPLMAYVRNISEFAALNPLGLIDDEGKSVVKGFGPDSIEKFHARARLKAFSGEAYLKSPVSFPVAHTELFFDIETDPMSERCYLHGFLERHGGENESESYVPFFATEPTAEAEHAAFAAAWRFIVSRRPCVAFIYSKYERTWWRVLRQKYPDVCSETELEALFSDAITVDLWETVQRSTEWPTHDYSLKTLAKYLGFAWRDPHPSGAASIEWYDRFVRGDQSAKARILEYNEDDCRAMRVLLDGIRSLKLRGQKDP